MLVRQSDIRCNNNIMDLLESMETVDINTKCAASVPIVEQTEGEETHYLIELEDLMEYAEYNSIHDLGYALSTICESSSVNPNSVTFTIQEHHAIEDQKLMDFSNILLREGIDVRLVPLSESDPVSIIGNFYLDQIDEHNYEYFINEFALLNEGIFEKLKNEYVYRNGKVYLVRRDPSRTGKTKSTIRILNHANAENIEGKDGKLHSVVDIDDLARVTNNDYTKMADFMLHSKNTTEHMKDDIQSMKKEGKSDKEIIEYMKSSPHVHSFIVGFNNVFNGGEMRKGRHHQFENPEFDEKVNNQYIKYRTVQDISNNLGSQLSDKSNRENESEFNKNKQEMLDKLKYAHQNLDQVDVHGLNDDPQKARERINKLSKMVEQEKFPKSWLAKKIAWLRSLYRNIMYKLSLKKSDGPWKSFTNPLRSLAAFILRVIDKLALKIQNAVS